MELTEQDIPLMKGRAYDMVGHNSIYRGIEDWYLTKRDSTLPIRINLEDATHPGLYSLRGQLVAQQEGCDNIPVQINFDGRWSVDRDNQLRGIWAQTDRAWYWLKRPCSRQITYPVHVTVDGIQQSSDNSRVVTYPSQDELHLELRAKLGLVSNLCDLFLFDETPDSLALMTRHATKSPNVLHQELTPSPHLLAKFPDRSPEPFDLQLLKRHGTFIKNHFLGFHPKFPNKCAFANALKQTVTTTTTAQKWTRHELLESALAAERRGGRYPWGELRHQDNDVNNAPIQRVNPNWVYAERLHEAANEINYKRESSRKVKTEIVDETLSPRLKKKMVHVKSEEVPRLKKRTGSESDAAVENSRKRADKRRMSDLVDTDDEDLVSQEEWSEESIQPGTSTMSPRNAKKLQRDVKGSPTPLKRTTKNGESAAESSRKRADKLRVSDLMDTDDEEMVNQESIDIQPGTSTSSPRKAKKLKRDTKRSLTPVRTAKDAGVENADGKSRSQTKAEDTNDKREEKSASEQRLSMILTETTFQTLRMNDALNDMRPYLNKEVCECDTMADLRAAGYAFGSNELAERFFVEKMRTSIITSWEYKVLVALVLSNIYQQKLETEVITKFEKALFGKGKAKNLEPGVKIYCERWRSQAVALFAEFEEALKSANSGKSDSHPLKTSLLAELLLEFCKFSAKCRVLKSKGALDTIKDPARYGIDFMQALEQASEITSKLKLASLSMECNTARGRFLAMMDDNSKPTAQAEKGKNIADSSGQPPSAAATSSTEQQPPSTINYRMAGQKLRMRAMQQRIVSACTTSSQENLPGFSVPPPQTNSTWGGKSAWGFPTDAENVPVEQGVSPDHENSIYAWAASSTRERFSIWGSAGERAMSKRPNSSDLKTSVTTPLLSSFVDPMGTMAITPAEQIANAISQAAASPTTVPQQSQLVMGVGNGKHHRMPGNGRGRGAHLNRPAWQTKSENVSLREHFVASPAASNVERPVQPHPVQPPRSDRRGPGLGRGSHVNKPAWMTSRDNDGAIPSRKPNDSQEPSVAVQAAAPTAFPETRVNPTLGRGRGRAMTMPAWMTTLEPNQNP